MSLLLVLAIWIIFSATLGVVAGVAIHRMEDFEDDQRRQEELPSLLRRI
jgi:hypothetical protein